MKRVLFLLILLPLVCSAKSENTVSENVVIETGSGPLAGTLQLPKNNYIKAVALIIAGSGPVDRDGNIKGLPGDNNSLKMLAESLAEKRIASVRYDKRRVGESIQTGLTESSLRFTHFIDDAESWIKYLDGMFDEPMFIIGHSQGALVGTVVASRTPVDGVVSVAGTAKTVAQIIRDQLQSQLPEQMMGEVENMLDDLNRGKLVEGPPELNAIFRDSVQPFLISWFKYNPIKTTSELELPILFIHGTTDLQVSEENAIALHASAKDSRLEIVDGMNHVLKPVSGDLKAQLFSYSEPTLELAPGLIRVIDEFISDISLEAR